MSLAQFWATVRTAWQRIVLMMLVAGAVAFGLASTVPKVYTAKARVMLDLNNSDPAQFTKMRTDMAAAYMGTEMRLVTDDAVMRAVVTTLGWPQNAQVIAAWQADPDTVADVTTWAGERLAQNVAVTPLEDSSIIEIYYTASTLDAAKFVVAAIRTAFIEQRQKIRAEAARHGSDWNQTQAAQALATLRAAEAKRDAFAKANGLVDTPAGSLDYDAQQTTMAQATLPVDQAPDRGHGDQVAAGLTRRLNAIDGQIAVLRLTGDQANPALVALTAQRAIVAQQLAHETAAADAAPDAGSGPAGAIRVQRDAAYLAARLALLGRAPLYDHLATMDRDVAFKAKLYRDAATRVANLASVAAAPSGAAVLGDVIADPDPTFPNIPLMVALAMAAALALGVAVTVMGELGRHQVRGTEDLTFVTGAPVLAVIAADRRPGWRSRLSGRLRWRSRNRPSLA